jgi:MATE family multidrug resistance protein
LDPAEELDAQDLELPTGDDGREVMIGRQALKVRRTLCHDAAPSTNVVQAEIPILLRNAVPAFLTQSAEFSLVLASVVSIGHLGTTDLAASR